MAEEIKPGDTVYVAHVDHGCATKAWGWTFVVVDMPMPNPGVFCKTCGASDIAIANEPVVGFPFKGKVGHMPRRWVKKMPPLGELEGKMSEEVALFMANKMLAARNG